MRSSHQEDGALRAGFLPDHQTVVADSGAPAPIAASVSVAGVATRTASLKLWVFGAVIVISSHGLWRETRRPEVAAHVPAAIIAPAPVVEPPRAEPSSPPRPEPVAVAPVVAAEPPKIETRSPEPDPPREDPADVRRRELDRARTTLALQLERADGLIDSHSFDDVEVLLERAGAEVQRFPDELSGERDELRRLQRRLVDARVNVETTRAKAALEQQEWDRRLALIESQIASGSYPEAVKLAASLINDPSVPERVASRALELRKEATDGLKAVFGEAKDGPATNKIRKPSSPPRN